MQLILKNTTLIKLSLPPPLPASGANELQFGERARTDRHRSRIDDIDIETRPNHDSTSRFAIVRTRSENRNTDNLLSTRVRIIPPPAIATATKSTSTRPCVERDHTRQAIPTTHVFLLPLPSQSLSRVGDSASSCLSKSDLAPPAKFGQMSTLSRMCPPGRHRGELARGDDGRSGFVVAGLEEGRRGCGYSVHCYGYVRI
ncbi:hypothetical protein SAICODRAFT_188253 [Saitoella complicata NRRL Y-17804]|uniref:uncharacterized protein n=1 Tax=Saitoella complicata (strain BCRC 22490 / CBS 7301 / JCM 7358 / NBRC 10748 / NRRL Y-17804) TaxID=698492 RepID=UPI000866A650|nr:uncharacterized protein SAICODRAFT_188253 [Saitoella complicata NRRL Y-17804]ODQ49898.1 hypothetical protein SAICODRAFT_188253 [Saitoella complicata NRRL Y-17804]